MNRAESQHPGVLLHQHYLEPLGVSASQLAVAIRIEFSVVQELLDGHRSITPDLAARLALFLDTPAHWWLEQQARYDASSLVDLERLRRDVTPFERLAEFLVTPTGVERLTPPGARKQVAPTSKVSTAFLDRLRAQTAGTPNRNRAVVERTLQDGTVTLTGV